ncbi:hypothetical protein [uncultured Aquimarina sp.]|uniref:hypothetical protein n=1 Tax=uncultured Aquimarina sp. TaxID=575652 RepID=UPI00260B3EC6|nr:hypothetical protein [uncultured Aquimarina sp.]
MKEVTDLLNDPLKRREGLTIAKTLDNLTDELTNDLILCGLKENDPSFNGEYIKLCVKHKGTKNIGDLLIKYFVNGSMNERIGSLKALYHVSEEPLILDESSNRFIENPKCNEHKTSYKEREKILINEYDKCGNIILKFFFQWAIPSKSGDFFKGIPETYEDLEALIDEDSQLKEQLTEYTEWN